VVPDEQTEQEAMIVEEAGEGPSADMSVWRAAFRGEHQIAEYVAQLEIGECAGILAAAPDGRPPLAARGDECRVGPGERRSFEEVIRT